ncbi:MAG: hypothetical protein ACE5G7_06075 [Candidatus Hydrothermarchaeaceae archaeon]
MAKDLKVLMGAAFILFVLVAGLSQYSMQDGKPALDERANEGAGIEQALLAENILVREVIVADSGDVEEAFGITLNGGKAAVILFESRYEGIRAGAAAEYVKAITKAFESGGDIAYALALATNIIGGVSKKPVLVWADRALAEEIMGKEPLSAYNHLNLKNLEIDEFVA